MGLREYAQQYGQQHGRNTVGQSILGGQTQQQPPQQTAAIPAIPFTNEAVYGIVGGSVVRVWGIVDIPGGSLNAVCSDPRDGVTAPVPLGVDTVKIFPGFTGQALSLMLEAGALPQR